MNSLDDYTHALFLYIVKIILFFDFVRHFNYLID